MLWNASKIAYKTSVCCERSYSPGVSWKSSPASNRGIANLRSECIKVLLAEAKPHLTDLPLPYHELGPTMKLVLDMWLPHLPLERLVDMLGYQFLAMASKAEIEEEPSEQYHYPEQAAVKRAGTPVAVKPGNHTWPICLPTESVQRRQSSFSHLS